MESRAESNKQHGTNTIVEMHKVSTSFTHETLLTAWVEDAATINSIYVPSPTKTNQHTAIIDSNTVSSCGQLNDPFITTGWVSTKIFHTLLRQKSVATEQKELMHNLQQPTKTVNIVPTLQASHSSLSKSKVADANYITMLMPTAVQIYNGETMNITTSKPLILTGWHNNLSGLWHVPLKAANKNTQAQANNVFELSIKQQIIAYYHAAAGYPT